MDLYLLRHGIAEDRNAAAPDDDSQRRLTSEGREKMRRAAEGMKSLEMNFDVVLTSPYLRAKETAEIVVKVLGIEKRLSLLPALAADGSSKELIAELERNFADQQNILLVGHEPCLSRLISILISGDTAIAINFKKGGLCKLTAETLRYGRCATLEWLLTPGQIRSVR